MALISFQGINIKTPSTYTVTIQDISNAERNANGTLIIERITTKRKIECTWNYMTSSEIASLFSLVASTTFSVTYVDPILGTTTKTFYAGDRSCGALDYRSDTIRYKDVKFNIIEI